MKINGIQALLLVLMSSATAYAATPANTLVIAQSIDDVISFDPAEGFELTTVQAFTNIYQRLVESNPQHPTQLDPILAKSWQAGPDQRSLLITLRPDAKFASGNPVRPEDVIFSLSRVVKLDKSPSFILTQLGWNEKNVDQYLQKTGDHEVKISWPVTASPDFVLRLLSAPVASIVDEKTVMTHQQNQDFGHDWLGSHSAGTGPYQIVKYQPHQALFLKENPTSPAGEPILHNILIKNVPDAATRRLLIEQGDVDIARNLGIDQISALENKPDVKPLAVPIGSIYYLMFNTKATADTSNPALWQASRYLFDYKGIANNLLKGKFGIHQTFLPEGFLGVDNETPFTYDPAKARAILEKAGLKNVSLKLSVSNVPPYIDIAQALQASFAKGGVKIELLPGLSSEISAQIKSHQYQTTLTSWGSDYFDPHTNASAFASSTAGPNTLARRANWDIPELSKQTDSAIAESDPAKRAAIYQKLQKDLLNNSPYVIGLQGKNLLAIRASLKGYVQGINPDMVYYNRVSKP